MSPLKYITVASMRVTAVMNIHCVPGVHVAIIIKSLLHKGINSSSIYLLSSLHSNAIPPPPPPSCVLTEGTGNTIRLMHTNLDRTSE